MADVLLGRTEGLEGFQRHVVLKRIRPEHAHDQRFIRMLLAEARVAATLHHHNIVQVHDVGEDAGEYFLAMEYLHGEDLRTILARAAKQRVHVPLDHAIAIVSAAAAGLHYAHERRDHDNRPLGIVHRDISPSNLLISYDGSIKIVDFGIAKALASASEETHSGHLRGKISYMSPEQCRGDRVDRRSDVYSLGVVLYEIATTKRLFKGESNYRVMEAIVNGQVVPPRTRRPELPDKLSEIIMRALATDPERRFATAEELRMALDQLSRRLGLMSSPPAIAVYMREQFGERPEPWVNLGTSPLPHAVHQAVRLRGDEHSPLPTSSGPWQTGPIAAPSSREGEPHARPANERYVAELPPPPIAPAVQYHRPPAPRPVRTAGGTRSATAKALIAAPLLLVLGLVVWRLTATEHAAPAVATAAAPAPAAGPRTLVATATPTPSAPAPSALTAAAAPTPTAAAPPTAAAAPTPTAAAPAVASAEAPKKEAAARELARAKPRTDTVAPKRTAAKRADEPSEPSPGQLAALSPAASPPVPSPHTPDASVTPPPAEPTAASPAAASARIAAHPPAEPAPSEAPPAPSAPLLVPLDANRIGGDKNIIPDDTTQTEVRRRGMERLVGIYKVCITASGDINSVSQVKSTGFAAYDRKIQTTIRTTWRYRPFLVNGQASAVCSAVQLAYVAQG